MALAASATWRIDYRRAMRRFDVIAIAFGVAAGAFGVSAGTGPLVRRARCARARRARAAGAQRAVHRRLGCRAAARLGHLPGPFRDRSPPLALAASALCALLSRARAAGAGGEETMVAARVTLAAAMVVTASGLLSFDLLLR